MYLGLIAPVTGLPHVGRKLPSLLLAFFGGHVCLFVWMCVFGAFWLVVCLVGRFRGLFGFGFVVCLVGWVWGFCLFCFKLKLCKN